MASKSMKFTGARSYPARTPESKMTRWLGSASVAGSPSRAARPQYRGARFRRDVRQVVVLASVCAFATIEPRRRGEIVRSGVAGVAIALGCEWYLRRKGITIDEDAVTLHRLFGAKRIRWSNIRAVDWLDGGQLSGDGLYLELWDGTRVIVNTVWHELDDDSHAGRASKIRLDTGEEVDALTLLADALLASQGRERSETG